MLPLQLHQAFPGKAAQPGIKRKGALLQVRREPLRGIEEGFLHHIGGIDACGQTPVQANGDHLAQPLAMSPQKLLPGSGVAAASANQKLLGIRFAGHHGLVSL
jgi:hypothetical protein